MGALLAPYRLAEPGSDPPGCVLAPDREDDLPPGAAFGEIALDAAPQGCRTVVAQIADGWEWRLTDGEGVAQRQGKGPARGNGTRPKLAIMEPCRSVALRAAGVDAAFPDVLVHVVIVWARIERTGKWAPDGAWAWSSEPAPGGVGRAWARPPRRFDTIGVPVCLLGVAPSALVLDVLRVGIVAAIREVGR